MYQTGRRAENRGNSDLFVGDFLTGKYVFGEITAKRSGFGCKGSQLEIVSLVELLQYWRIAFQYLPF